MPLLRNFIESPYTTLVGLVIVATTTVAVLNVPEVKLVWDGLAGYGASLVCFVLNEKAIASIINKVVNKLTK